MVSFGPSGYPPNEVLIAQFRREKLFVLKWNRLICISQIFIDTFPVFFNNFPRRNQTIAPNAIGGVVMIPASKSITIKPHFSYPIFLQYRGDKLQGTIIADNISDLPRQSSVTIIYGRSTNFLKILDQHSNPGTNPDNKSYKCNVTLDCNHSECSNNDFVPWLFLWNRSLLCFPFVRCSIEISVHDLLHFIFLVRWILLF